VRIGVIFPQLEIGTDPIGIRDYVQAAEGLGYSHIAAFDHVLGADVSVRPGWTGPYTLSSMFHEPFVLFGYIAAFTSSIEVVTCVLVLPQRETALVAKQAAEVDVLTRGRLRLGIGVGWNDVEYQALGQSFTNRGKRSEEQIAVLRALFSQDSVTFHGRWHTIEAAGINPRPVRQPLPIWLGGSADATLHRVGKLADGWFPQIPPDDTLTAALAKVRRSATDAGRDPTSIGVEGRIPYAGGTPDSWPGLVQAWESRGASHLALNTMRAQLAGPAEHIAAIRRFKESLGKGDHARQVPAR
jgi:probable F420-dependent oxidoreductase